MGKPGRPKGLKDLKPRDKAYRERDPNTGKFLPNPTDDELVAGLDAFNQVVNVKKELKKLQLLSMKYLRGTIKLDNAQAQLLREMYRTLADKLVGNARSGEQGPQEISIKIKGPKKPRGVV